MKKKNIYIVILAFTSLSLSLKAQGKYLDQIGIENQAAVNENNMLLVYMDLVLDQVQLNSNEMITLTPVVTANGDKQSIALAPMIINGNRRQKMIERGMVLNKKNLFKQTPQSIVQRANGMPQKVRYSATVPFEDWMSNASLSLQESVTGCAECDLGEGTELVAQRILPPAYVPVYKLTYIVPDVEPVKQREDTYSATLNFRVDKHNLDRNYMNNAAILADVDNVVNGLMTNKDLTVSDFRIEGFASPEASVAYNKALAERRADSFADYLSKKFNVDKNRMKVSGFGEDWNKTREVIASSGIADKAEILRIINNVSNPDARDAELMKLSGGTTYQTMLREYYPKVRRTEYTVSYVARAFSVEEGKKVIKTNPKLLSLNEMYLVAQSYPADSKEFKEVFDIATRLYPNEPIAIINSAAADIEGGNNQAAIDRMQRIENDPRTWNNLGVAYARLGNFEKAKEYFDKAVARNDNDAVANTEELQKVAK
jgi:outer membrane protein OmpA-like peptidoglycan-associated protein